MRKRQVPIPRTPLAFHHPEIEKRPRRGSISSRVCFALGKFRTVPKDNPLFLERAGYINDSLVPAALEAQVEVLFRKDEFPVNKNVQIAQHFHRNGWVTQAPFQHIFIKEIAAVAPNGLLRIVLTHMAQDANKNRLIFRFKGLPTKREKPLI